MFKRKETQSLLETRTKNLKKAEKIIKDLRDENIALYEENKDLRFELEESNELIKRIERFVSSNKYNNEKSALNKIKELVSDYQSLN